VHLQTKFGVSGAVPMEEITEYLQSADAEIEPESTLRPRQVAATLGFDEFAGGDSTTVTAEARRRQRVGGNPLTPKTIGKIGASTVAGIVGGPLAGVGTAVGLEAADRALQQREVNRRKLLPKESARDIGIATGVGLLTGPLGGAATSVILETTKPFDK
jgi:hypothetical protein